MVLGALGRAGAATRRSAGVVVARRSCCSCWSGTHGSPARSPGPPLECQRLGLGPADRLRRRRVAGAGDLVGLAGAAGRPAAAAAARRPGRIGRSRSRHVKHAARRRGRMERGIWSPFRSLLGAQVIAAGFGLVFWIIVARLVDQHDLGVAAAAISAQTLLGMICALGLGTMLIAELPLHDPQRQRRLVLRSLLVVGVFATVVGAVMVAVGPVLPDEPPGGARRPGRRARLRARHRRGQLVLRARRVLPGTAPLQRPGRAEPARGRAAVPDDRGCSWPSASPARTSCSCAGRCRCWSRCRSRCGGCGCPAATGPARRCAPTWRRTSDRRCATTASACRSRAPPTWSRSSRGLP